MNKFVDLWVLLACVLQVIHLSWEVMDQAVLIVHGDSLIGYHTALHLAVQQYQVVVIDDFKNSINKQRTHDMSERKNIKVYQGNACDTYLLMELFQHHKFQTIVYSPSKVQDMERLLEQSMECINNLLEITRKHKNTRLVLLSSSEVYNESPVHRVPSSTIEIALKASTEDIATTYCQLYDVSVMILRLSNVYGPWSEPGNIIHDISEQLYHDIDIQTPFESFEERDFTYVDDVVAAVQLSLDHTPKGCSEVYNIGSGKTVSLHTILDILANSFNMEKKLDGYVVRNSKSTIQKLNLVPAKEILNYNPKIAVEEGLLMYASWFKENVNGRNSFSNFMADSSMEDGAKRNHVKHKSELYLDRIHDLRQEYETYAEQHGYSVAKLYRDKTFKKRSGFSFKNGNDQKTRDLSEIHYRCQAFDECMGYDSNGRIKGVLDSESSWQRSSGAVYIADVDVCKAGVHNCYGNASCVSTEFGQFKCACPSGWKLYKGHDCVELYKVGHRTVAETIEKITDKIDGLNWNTFASNNNFYPFKGKTVKNEYLAYYPEASGNIQLLTEACIKSYHCMGFTSDGVLMTNVDVRKWVDDYSVTLYARDVDYCSVDEVLCRPGQHCHRVSPGKWACS